MYRDERNCGQLGFLTPHQVTGRLRKDSGSRSGRDCVLGGNQEDSGRKDR